MHLIVHDVSIGLSGGASTEGSGVVEELKGNDAKRPPVTANSVVGCAVQAGEHLGGYVLRSTHRQTRLQLGGQSHCSVEC